MSFGTQSLLTSVFFLLFLNPELRAKQNKFKNFIAFEDIYQSQVPKIESVFGIYVEKSFLYSFLDNKDYFYKSSLPTKPNQNSPGLNYMPFQKGENGEVNYKYPLSKLIGKGRWIARAGFLNLGFFLLDARLKVAALDENGVAIAKRDIILDRLRPAADTRGEPTHIEIQEFRSKIKKNFAKLGRNSIVTSGFIQKPRGFSDVDGSQFLLVSRIRGFTLLTMKCDREDLSYCEIKRGCFLSGAEQIEHDKVTGIGYSAKRNILLIGDIKYNRLFAYHFKSCHHVSFLGVIHLPEKMSRLRAFYIDNDDSLWIATENKDSYLNSTVYVFKNGAW